MDKTVKIIGARQNNLKNLTLEIPLEKMVCITGPSGSGKSSLAFDTLYAEGYRRYVESLSTYARQFFEKVPKPDVDTIENVCPSIALQQKNPIKNSRSTVGTSTEVYDYVRLMFSKIGEVFCPNGHGKISSDTPQSSADAVLTFLSGESDRGYLGFYLPEEIKADALIEQGFLRRLKSEKQPDALELEAERGKSLPVGTLIILDRLVVGAQDRFRLIESFESSFRQGKGDAFLFLVERKKMFRFSSQDSCSECGIAVPRKSPLLFSFNSPLGACPNCKGFGNTLEYDESLLIPRPRLTLERGAIDPFTKKMMTKGKKKLFDFLEAEGIPKNVPYTELSAEHKKMVLRGKGKYKGVVGAFVAMEEKKYKLHVRVFLRRYQASIICKVCKGARLRPEALYFKVKDHTIFDLCIMPLGQVEKWFQKLKLKETDGKIIQEIRRQIESRTHFLNRMGLHYLNLHRLSKSLSGGESQRIALANQLGAELSGTLYVLDEPSIGLHAIDRDRLLDSLRELVDRGNSVVVVEHDIDTVKKADQIIEMGPKSGNEGGQIIFQGDQEEFSRSNTLTADFAMGRRHIAVPEDRREGTTHWLSIQGATENNLQDVNLRLPLNRLIGISGVSGSGKSTLIRQTLFNALDRLFNQSTESIGRFKKLFGSDRLKGVVLLDQSPIGRTSRSIPLSVIGAYDEVRQIFAEVAEQRGRAWGPGHFSFNVTGGRCETCKGEGFVTTEMYFLDDLKLLCEDCGGKRFKKEVLELKYRGKNIDDILQMTVSTAKAFFSDRKSLILKFQQLERVGLGYLQLGQPSQSLSGGESQRLKIATEIFNVKKKQHLYILDEPTTGLHVSEIEVLISLLQDLVDAGNTVVVIEHQLDVLKCVDWLVDLGPGAGVEGGRIVGEGTPEEVARLNTPTGSAMKMILAAAKTSSSTVSVASP